MPQSADKNTCFQTLILKLQSFWAGQGCVLLQPYDIEVGAGTFHPDPDLSEGTYREDLIDLWDTWTLGP